MRLWCGLGALATLAGCTPVETRLVVIEIPRGVPCDLTSIHRTYPADGAAVAACAAPTAEQIAFACRVATAVATPGEDDVAPELEVRNVTCDFAGEGASQARCRFEQKVEGQASWSLAETDFTHTFWRLDDEVSHMLGTRWRAHGLCG